MELGLQRRDPAEAENLNTGWKRTNGTAERLALDLKAGHTLPEL